MADVTINIRQTNNCTISVAGQVDDALLAPFTTQLSSLLSTAVASSGISSTSQTASA
jgi:hypothetical protein